MSRPIFVRVVLVAALALVVPAAAQSLRVPEAGLLPSFEAAVVKPVDPSAAASRVVAPNRFHRPVTTAMELIMDAFGIQRYRVIDAPAWAMESSRFEVLATTPEPVTDQQVGPYLQRLLAERFGLRAHVEQRELPFYELMTTGPDGRLGPRLARTTDDCPAIIAERTRNGVVGPPIPRTPDSAKAVCMYYVYARVTPSGQRSIRYLGGGMTMPRVADILASPAGRVVIDRTGLAGLFDIDLEYALVNTGTTPGGSDDLPSVFTAVQEQLGLRLSPGRGPLDVLVIDELTQPTEN